LKQN